MKNYKLSTALAVSLAVASTSLVADATDISGILPNAQPGECYAKVIIPAKFETTTEKILAKEASERLQIIPAKYGTASEGDSTDIGNLTESIIYTAGCQY